MKKQFLLAGLLVILYSASFAQNDYRQYEVIYLKPKLDKLDLLRKGIAAHNKKYHAADPYKAGVSAIITGPNSGDYVWVMGPAWPPVNIWRIGKKILIRTASRLES